MQIQDVLAEFTVDVHANTNDEGVVMLEALSEDLTTQDMMSFYACSDFPFNFNLIVNLKTEDLSDNNYHGKPSFTLSIISKQGASLHDQVADWLENMPHGKTANWVLGNHDNWR